MTLRIRRADASDADALSAISRDTFVETFGHLYKPVVGNAAPGVLGPDRRGGRHVVVD